MSDPGPARLRRDLGTLESYATIVGILIGAGIFRVTTEAWTLTGSSVILGYLVLAPAVLATSVPYAVFLSTPLGRSPGGEYTHLTRTLHGYRLAFVGAWLKIISYLGALAYLSRAFADYVLQLAPSSWHGDAARLGLALASLAFFFGIHALGVRMFGRLQVAMCALLALSLVVLIVPGLRAIHLSNYAPVFTGGFGGFARALPPLFFAYAGFESLAQTAGEVKDSTRQLPRVFVRGILVTTLVFALVSIVTFGVLPGERLRDSTAPMADVAAVYLPANMVWIITVGALMAIATSLNATMLVPSRLALMLARDGLSPAWVAAIHPRTGTPVRGLTLTFLVAAGLLVSGQVSLALDIAVLALVVLYLLHSVTLLLLPRRNPQLWSLREVGLPAWLIRAAAVLSVLSMAGLVVVQVGQDARAMRALGFVERVSSGKFTSVELLLGWSVLGLALYGLGRGRRGRVKLGAATESAPAAGADIYS
jgi:amino acid transporter